MLPKERVAAAFAGKPTDKVPLHHVGTCSAVASAILGREACVGGGIQQWREITALWNGKDAHDEFIERSYRDAVDFALAVDNDIVRVSYWRYDRKPSRKIDDYTYIFENGRREADWQVFKYDPATEQSSFVPYVSTQRVTLDDLEQQIEQAERTVSDYVPAEDDFAFEFRAARELSDQYAIRIGGVGVGVTHDEIWLEALALDPALVARQLDVQAENAVRNVDFLAERGFEYLFGGYDFASQTGPMISPKMFGDLVVPRLKKVSHACRAHNVKHLFASDGNLWAVADKLFVDSGIDGYYEIDRLAGMDLRRLRADHPGLTLIGNISSTTVHTGTRADVVRECLDCLDTARAHGRVIAGISNYIVPGTPIDNALAMVETLREYR